MSWRSCRTLVDRDRSSLSEQMSNLEKHGRWHPLLGLGPEGPKYHFKEYVPADIWATRPAGFYEHLHNVYLQYGAERGIAALLVFLWLMIRILVDFARGLRALPRIGRASCRERVEISVV